MKLQLYNDARTTPAIGRELQSQPASDTDKELADAHNLTRHNVAKWRKRESAEDGSYRPHSLHANLSPAQEAVVLALHESLLLLLDDLLAVAHEFINPELSRSGWNRCLSRHGVARLKELRAHEREADKEKHKSFKDYELRFVHLDVKYLPQMPDEDQRKYLFAAIDRATRWVYAEILPEKSAMCTQGFLKRLIEKAPFSISNVLTDNGKEFTDRFCATAKREPTGNHPFEQACASQKIDHRLTRPKDPRQTA